MGASTSSLEEEEGQENGLISYEEYQEKERELARASLPSTKREEQKQKQRLRAKASSFSEYQQLIHRSKVPMEHKPWEPKDIETDPEKESELMKKMQNAIVELERSDFYSKFLQQIQTPQFLNHFSRVLGSEPKFQVVIYGHFNPLSSWEPSLMKLALILLLKRDFKDRIGEIEIFDSKLDKTEVRVLEDLGFSVLRVENSYRSVSKPTLFFIPNFFYEVYDHVLRANWKPENLNRMILLGSDFKGMKSTEVIVNEIPIQKCKFNGRHIRISRYLMCIPRFTTEIPMSSIDGDKLSQKFTGQTWHFFTWFDDVPKMKTLLKPVVVVVAGIFYYLFYKYRKCKYYLQEERNYSTFFGLGWLFRRHRIRRCLLEEKRKKKKKKKQMLFYVSRAIVLPWFEGLPRKTWAEVRRMSRGVMTWMKENDGEISHRQLDILIEAWF